MDGETALLRCGGDILKMRMREVVSGLPDDQRLIREAVKILQESGELIYLHGDEEGRLGAGLPVEQTQEPLVKAVQSLSVEPAFGTEHGLICRSEESMGLYWLPSKNAAWTRLSPSQLRNIFLSAAKGYFKASKSGDGSISVIDTTAAKKEFESYKVGKQLVVRILSNVDVEPAEQRYLAESFSSKVVLECRGFDAEDLMEKTCTVEVSSYSLSPFKMTVYPIGKRPQALDLPGWMMAMLKPNNETRREEFTNYLRWREEVAELPGRDINLKQAKGDELNRLLCQAHKLLDDPSCEDKLKGQIALAWKRSNWRNYEIDLVYAVMATLLLEELGFKNNNELWRAEARELAQDLSGRALRSVHIEVLYQKWLSNSENRNPPHNHLWKRVNQVLSGIESPPTSANISAIRQLRRALELRNITERSQYDFKEIQSISDSLSASVGQISNRLSEERDAPLVTRYLIEIHQGLPTTKLSESAFLNPDHVDKLKRILKAINERPLDITLLDNLTELERTVAS